MSRIRSFSILVVLRDIPILKSGLTCIYYVVNYGPNTISK